MRPGGRGWTEGKPRRVSLELLGKGRELAGKLGGSRESKAQLEIGDITAIGKARPEHDYWRRHADDLNVRSVGIARRVQDRRRGIEGTGDASEDSRRSQLAGGGYALGIDDAAMAAFPDPAFAVREVTDDPRYTGGELVRAGVPDEKG